MTNAIQNIVSELNAVFAPMDIEVLEQTKVWAKARAEAVQEFKKSEEYNNIRFDSWKLYGKLHALAGGKTWYQVFGNGYSKVSENFVVKNCAAIASKRNASIAYKLEKAGVTEVSETTFTRTKDGFNGVFHVMTNTGKKVVIVETIRAGGYNVQCLHLRVLVKVK